MKSYFAAALLLAASSLAAAEVQIHHGYLRATPPGVSNSAGFMLIRNNGGTDLALTGAHSDQAAVTELHNHVNDNGVMKMRQVAQIALPAGGAVELKPGGLHLMLMGLKGPLKVGDRARVTLQFDDGSSQTLELPVQKRAAAQGH